MRPTIKNIFREDPLVLKVTRDSSFSREILETLQRISELTGLRSCTIPCKVAGNNQSVGWNDFMVEYVSSSQDKELNNEVLQWFLKALLRHLGENEPRSLDVEQRPLGPHIGFRQDTYRVFEKYCENLIITGGSQNALLQEGFGLRKISLAEEDNAFIRRFYESLPEGGLTVSQVKTSHTHHLKPLLVDFAEHNPHLDDDWQKIIANAYWQTCWATGAIRGTRGDTEPVVFFPLGWSESGAFYKEVNTGKFITSRRFFECYEVMQAVQQGLVSFDPRDKKFLVSDELSNRQELEKILNRKAFCDLFIGQNTMREEPFLLRRAVPVMGSHLLSSAISEQLGMGREPRRLPYAGSNSVFFLNFPEEYPFYYTAMNAPVGLLARESRIYQPALLKRGCLYYAGGKHHIDTFSIMDMEIILPDKTIWQFHKEEEPGKFVFTDTQGHQSIVYSPFWMVHHQKTSPATCTEFTIVSDQIVEINEKGENPVPQNGFVMSFPEDVSGWRNFSSFTMEYQVLKEGRYIEMESAISCGPVLLKEGHMLPVDFFNEDQQLKDKAPENFLPYKKEGTYNPLVPTRFPHFTTQVRAPRTFLGVDKENLHLIVVDGRSTEKHSIGMTLHEEALFLSTIGCEEGLNLDGGGSTVLWAKKSEGNTGGVVNLPSDKGHQERLMPIPIVVE